MIRSHGSRRGNRGLMSRRIRGIALSATFALILAGEAEGLEKRIHNAPSPAQRVTTGGFSVSVRVTERSGTNCPDQFLVTGVPFAKGVVQRSQPIRILDGVKPLPGTADALAYWSDGSVRWVRLRVPVPLLPDQTKDLLLVPGDGSEPKAAGPDLPEMSLEISTDHGSIDVPLSAGAFDRHGDLGIETDIEPLGARRGLVRLMVAQLERDAVWHDLVVHVVTAGSIRPAGQPWSIGRGEWCAAVFRGAERGPIECVSTPRGFDIRLLASTGIPLAADRGFHVTYEVVFERSRDPDALARRVSLPLRASFPGTYVDDTRAMGRVGAPGSLSRGLDAGFQSGWDRLREQQALPRNRGPQAWGDFFDRKNGLAYAGYLNQEYDPAVAFFEHYARTGDGEALDLALDMARQYADACTGLRGGNYQHRVTLEALEDQVARWVAGGLTRRWRTGDTPASGDRILAYVGDHYGEAAARFTQRSLASATEQTSDPGAIEALMAHLLGNELVYSARDELAKDPRAERIGERDPDFRAYAEMLLAQPLVHEFGSASLDSVFRPFFTRYGGSWADFPAFHFYNIPSEEKQHDASHSLVEMLVLGYFWSGDPSLGRAALRVARYHVEGGLVDRAVERVATQVRNKQPSMARDVGWALINLLALETMTEGTEPELHRQIEDAIERLRASILSIEPQRYAGPIHLGVVGEALAMDHARYQNARVRSYLIDLYRTWCHENWDSRANGFRSSDQGENDASLAVTGLNSYGLAYAATEDGDPLLVRTAQQALRGLADARPASAKSLAQTYRGSFRAAGLIDASGGFRKHR